MTMCTQVRHSSGTIKYVNCRILIHLSQKKEKIITERGQKLQEGVLSNNMPSFFLIDFIRKEEQAHIDIKLEN